MQLIDRYIARTVLAATGVVLLAFGSINTLFPLIEELGGLGAGYGAGEAAAYVLWTTPRRIYEIMPYVIFMGGLVGLGMLANNAELIVLRAAGVSVARIVASLTLAALPVMAANFALGEWVAPWGEATGEALKARARQGGEIVRLGEGRWYREDDLFMRFDAMDGDGNLLGVRQYRLGEDRSLRYTRQADGARHDAAAGVWLLEDVLETHFDDGQVRTRHQEVMRWESRVDPELLGTSVMIEPRRLALTDLHRQIDFLLDQGLDARRYQLALWGKLLQPAATLGLILIAVGFILGPLRERSMGVRIATGILVGLGFNYLQQLFGPMAMVYAVPAWLAVLTPIFIGWAAGLYGLRRVA